MTKTVVDLEAIISSNEIKDTMKIKDMIFEELIRERVLMYRNSILNVLDEDLNKMHDELKECAEDGIMSKYEEVSKIRRTINFIGEEKLMEFDLIPLINLDLTYYYKIKRKLRSYVQDEIKTQLNKKGLSVEL